MRTTTLPLSVFDSSCRQGTLYSTPTGEIRKISKGPSSPSSTRSRFDGVCTTTSSPGPSAEARRLCNVVATFSEEREGAEIDAQGVGRIEAEDVVFAVTGGNREFRNARGQATFEYEEREDAIVITYEVDAA